MIELPYLYADLSRKHQLKPPKWARSDDIDAILDEIDEVLEENAEEFVRS